MKERYSNNTLYIIGPCIVAGYLLKIEQSLPMMLQNEISFYNYNVVKIFIAEKDFGMINEL